MTNDLKQHLLENPHLEHVYVNDSNEWQFHKRPGFETEYTRDEVLEMDLPDKQAEPTSEPKNTDHLEAELEKTIEALIATEGERDDLVKEKEDWATEKAELEKTIEALKKQIEGLKNQKPKSEPKKPNEKSKTA